MSRPKSRCFCFCQIIVDDWHAIDWLFSKVDCSKLKYKHDDVTSDPLWNRITWFNIIQTFTNGSKNHLFFCKTNYHYKSMIIHGNSTKFCSNILQNHVRNIWQDISTDFKNVAQVQIWRKILAIFKSDRLGATHPAPVKCKHVKHIRVTIIRSKNINRLRNFDLLE